MKTKNAIIEAFDSCAQHYEKAATIQKEIGQRLLERLDYLKIIPRYVLDLGCGTGVFTQLLKKRYPNALIVGLDFALGMLSIAKKKCRFWQKWPLVNADMMHLPFEEGIFDLVFANQVLHWAPSLQAFFAELNRIMKKEGCLLFSTLGPDTFKEVKIAFKDCDTHQHTNEFTDMHNIGDQLLEEHFLDPVVDMEFITLHYASLKQLVASLKAQGVKNIHEQRNKGLTGKKVWQGFEESYQKLVTEQNKYPLTYEVVYGSAWKGQLHKVNQQLETRIPISDIKRRQS